MNDLTLSCLKLSITPYFGYARFLKAIELKLNISKIISDPLGFKENLKLRQESIDFLVQNKHSTYCDKAKLWLQKQNKYIISYFDDEYPDNLKQLTTPPLVLYCIGNPKLLKTKQIAIVGARNCSTYGKNATDKIVSELVSNNISITSGLAYGIDTLAHSSALKNNGQTIAVIGTGIDIVYPSSNHQLARDISNKGLIISEFAFGTAPKKHNFPQRNRVISALAKGAVIIEATKKSGSLITAQYALEQNKEVFAVPGSIFSQTSNGCNELIKQGAKLVECANDILEELNLNIDTSSVKVEIKDKIHLEPLQQKVYDCIESELTTIDTIINTTNIPYNQVTQITFELELKSLINSIPGGFSRV